jgi:large subunit ribosomal protein L23
MALFGRNKNKDEAKKADAPKAAAAPTPASLSGTRADVSHVLKHARVTEKASENQGQGVYTFEIAERATKRQVMQAVFALYKVMPRKVAVVPVPQKKRRSMKTGKSGISRGGRKAYVYLKKGETITLQ